eukprot:1962429-Amphidinium_carterae.1
MPYILQCITYNSLTSPRGRTPCQCGTWAVADTSSAPWAHEGLGAASRDVQAPAASLNDVKSSVVAPLRAQQWIVPKACRRAECTSCFGSKGAVQQQLVH